ncbi:MAG TPA: MazG nucleotide pyrophosphohydrolase domain-containing protein [Candidatus Saccharibacteria bacterium]|nr:MazG nucleotide pyrophosphohydrolase domain-containing protein [Candidatus Saccharibacteria bacterium]
MSDIADLQKRAEEIRAKYDEYNAKNGQSQWNNIDYIAGLVGDVGDLVKLVMAAEGKRSAENLDAKIRHELGDVLWSLLVIAGRYGLNLEEAFHSTMNELDERLAA